MARPTHSGAWTFKHCFAVPGKWRVGDFEPLEGTMGDGDDRLREVYFEEVGSDTATGVPQPGYVPPVREVCAQGFYDGDPESYPREAQVSERTWDLLAQVVCERLPELCGTNEFRLLDSAVEPAEARPPEPTYGGALDVVSRHRRALGMPPLDPAAAGWTDEDVVLEAERIRRLPNVAGHLMAPGWG